MEKKCPSSTALKIRKCLSNLHKKGRHTLNIWTIVMQSLIIKEWKLLELQIIQTRNHLSMTKFKTPKNKKKIHEMCIKWGAHLQCVINHYPLSISEGKECLSSTPVKNGKYLLNVHKMEGAHLQCANNHYAKYEYKVMNTVGVSDYIH